MSVQSEIDRIAGAKSNISTAITNKGVTVPSGTKLDGMAALIDSISSGGGGGSSGGGYLKGTNFENISVAITLIDMFVVSCTFANSTCIFKTDCSNVTFKDCSFYYSSIECTQEIRDAIENGEGNSFQDTTWQVIV